MMSTISEIANLYGYTQLLDLQSHKNEHNGNTASKINSVNFYDNMDEFYNLSKNPLSLLINRNKISLFPTRIDNDSVQFTKKDFYDEFVSCPEKITPLIKDYIEIKDNITNRHKDTVKNEKAKSKTYNKTSKKLINKFPLYLRSVVAKPFTFTLVTTSVNHATEVFAFFVFMNELLALPDTNINSPISLYDMFAFDKKLYAQTSKKSLIINGSEIAVLTVKNEHKEFMQTVYEKFNSLKITNHKYTKELARVCFGDRAFMGRGNTNNIPAEGLFKDGLTNYQSLFIYPADLLNREKERADHRDAPYVSGLIMESAKKLYNNYHDEDFYSLASMQDYYNTTDKIVKKRNKRAIFDFGLLVRHHTKTIKQVHGVVSSQFFINDFIIKAIPDVAQAAHEYNYSDMSKYNDKSIKSLYEKLITPEEILKIAFLCANIELYGKLDNTDGSKNEQRLNHKSIGGLKHVNTVKIAHEIFAITDNDKLFHEMSIVELMSCAQSYIHYNGNIPMNLLKNTIVNTI